MPPRKRVPTAKAAATAATKASSKRSRANTTNTVDDTAAGPSEQLQQEEIDAANALASLGEGAGSGADRSSKGNLGAQKPLRSRSRTAARKPPPKKARNTEPTVERTNDTITSSPGRASSPGRVSSPIDVDLLTSPIRQNTAPSPKRRKTPVLLAELALPESLEITITYKFKWIATSYFNSLKIPPRAPMDRVERWEYRINNKEDPAGDDSMAWDLSGAISLAQSQIRRSLEDDFQTEQYLGFIVYKETALSLTAMMPSKKEKTIYKVAIPPPRPVASYMPSSPFGRADCQKVVTEAIAILRSGASFLSLELLHHLSHQPPQGWVPELTTGATPRRGNAVTTPKTGDRSNIPTNNMLNALAARLEVQRERLFQGATPDEIYNYHALCGRWTCTAKERCPHFLNAKQNDSYFCWIAPGSSKHNLVGLKDMMDWAKAITLGLATPENPHDALRKKWQAESLRLRDNNSGSEEEEGGNSSGKKGKSKDRRRKRSPAVPQIVNNVGINFGPGNCPPFPWSSNPNTAQNTTSNAAPPWISHNNTASTATTFNGFSTAGSEAEEEDELPKLPKVRQGAVKRTNLKQLLGSSSPPQTSLPDNEVITGLTLDVISLTAESKKKPLLELRKALIKDGIKAKEIRKLPTNTLVSEYGLDQATAMTFKKQLKPFLRRQLLLNSIEIDDDEDEQEEQDSDATPCPDPSIRSKPSLFTRPIPPPPNFLPQLPTHEASEAAIQLREEQLQRARAEETQLSSQVNDNDEQWEDGDFEEEGGYIAVVG